MTTVTDQLYVSYEGIALSPDKMMPIGNNYGQFMLKPSGGLWTSPLIGSDDSAFVGQIQQMGRVDHWLGPQHRRYHVTPAADARVLVLDSWQDFMALVKRNWRHRLNLPQYQRMDTTFHIAQMLCQRESPIDWTLLTEHYDAIWARNYLPPRWDCECVVWLRWCFSEVAEVTKELAL